MHTPSQAIADVQLRSACAELERRLRGGEACTAEELLAASPDLASQTDLALELVYTEFVVREQLGQRPEPTAWYERFPQWRHDLEQLFQVHQAVQPSQAVSTHDAGPVTSRSAPGAEAPCQTGRRFGNYVLLEELGRGGAGVVYKARQAGLDRLVAVKLILSGDWSGRSELARFHTEAGAAAALQHPNIVQVFEVGAQDGQPFLAQELVEGGSLEAKRGGVPWLARASAELVQTVARAMHYAHTQGVIHRDLKPANILLTADGAPKVSDFGLARRTPPGDVTEPVRDAATQTGAILGTPGYLAPEQAAGHSRDVGPTADIYGLGAILYALLTGRPPFQGVSVLETLEQVRSQEAVPPRQLQAGLPRDLETICLKCLRKESEKRYASAADLADDLQRYLAGEPIRARPTAAWERALKWVRRRPAVAGLLLLVVISLVAGIVGVTWQWLIADRERSQAVRETSLKEQALTREQEEGRRKDAALDKAELNAYLHGIALARASWLADDVVAADRFLQECPSARRQWEWHFLYRLCHAERLALKGPPPRIDANGEGVLCKVAYSRDGQILAAGGGDGLVRTWDANGRLLRTYTAGDQVVSLVFSPDRSWLAAIAVKDGRRFLRVWNTKTGDLSLDKARGAIYPVEFFQNSSGLFSLGGRGLDRWDLASGRESNLRTKLGNAVFCTWRPTSSAQYAVADSLNQNDWKVQLWDMPTGAIVRTFAGHKDNIRSLCFSRDGRRLLSASNDQTVKLWNADTGDLLQTYHGFRAPVHWVRFLPDGQQFLTLSGQRTIKKWDIATGQELGAVHVRMAHVGFVDLRPDGQRVALSSLLDSTIQVWDLDSWEYQSFDGFPPGGGGVFSPDGKRYGLHNDVCDTTTMRSLLATPEAAYRPDASVFSPDSRYFVRWNPDRSVTVWDIARGAAIARVQAGQLSVPVQSKIGKRHHLLAVSPDGRRLATSYDGITVTLWEVESGRETARWTAGAAASTYLVFSPDGRFLVHAGADHAIRVWDVDANQEVQALRGHAGRVLGLAFHPKGQLLASAAGDRTVRVWELESGAERFRMREFTADPLCVAFSPNGQRLAAGTEGKAVHLFDMLTGREILKLTGDVDPYSLAFASEGGQLRSLGLDRRITVWNGTPMRAADGP
jgi:WD40 repeat protein